MEKKLQKPYPTDSNSLIVQDLVTSSLSNIVDNLAKGIHKIKCKYGHYDKKCETCGIKYKDSKCCLKYINVKKSLIECKCFCCKKNCQKTFNENLKERFADT